ncbi:hypothetical protein Z962_p0063 (plasmid) [Clostridium botulinum C/D str. BKT12695]|nr:hypothetical protein Z962_p0063 [Clostridium botulinum C/D str. BKT12695]
MLGGCEMKISSIISFIILLLLGIGNVFSALGMECLLQSGDTLIKISIMCIIVAIVIFISGLKENKVIFCITSIVMIVLSFILFGLFMNANSNDMKLHQQLLNNHDTANKIGFLTLVMTLILGIVNTILGFMKKTKQ